MPVGDILVGDTGGNVKHDDTTLPLDVVSITQATEFLLAGSIPYVKADGTKVGGEGQRVNLDTKSSCAIRSEVSRVWYFDQNKETYQCTSSQTRRSSGAR